MSDRPWKCQGCEHWNDGEGVKRCLTCYDYSQVDHRQYSIMPDYHADIECIEPLMRVQDVTLIERMNRLDNMELSMLLLYKIGRRPHAEIAKHYGRRDRGGKKWVSSKIRRAILKLRD